MKLDKNIPIYLQVIDDLKSKMASGEFSPGDKLVSVRELSIEYGINPNTASRVYNELEREELCFTRRGIGTFLSEDPKDFARLKREMAEEIISRARSDLAQLGLSREEIKILLEEEL